MKIMEINLSTFKETLTKLLREEVSCATSLFESLESESMALSNLDDKLITINSAHKRRLIEALQLASNARIRLMAEQGLGASPDDIKEFVSSNDSDTELNVLFIRLSEIAQVCFAENRLIGQLINRRTHFISQALNSLSPTADLKSITYGKNGIASRASNPNSFCSV